MAGCVANVPERPGPACVVPVTSVCGRVCSNHTSRRLQLETDRDLTTA